MIQSAQVASKFTLFTHHAKTFPDLVTALRNSMLRAGVFKDEKTAEEQVVQVLNFDIHLVKDFRGVRYIERITECIPVEEKNEYTFDHRNEKTLEGKFEKFMDNATIFFTKTTNREMYKYRNIMEYVNDGYVLTNPISDKNIKEMRINMEDSDMLAFDAFLERNWGIQLAKTKVIDKVNTLNVKDAIPVSAEVENVTKVAPKKKSPEEVAKIIKQKQEIAKKMGVKTATKTKSTEEKKVAKTKKTTTVKKKTTKSSILNDADFEDDEK